MRVLILSDIHGNLVALETVLNAAKGQYDEIWCLGDIVGYGPSPNECVDLLRDRTSICIIGNHDWAVLDRPGIDVEDFNPAARHAVLWTQEQLSSRARHYLDTLIDQPVQPQQSNKLLLTHASPREPVWEYILTPSIALENFAHFTQEICLVGHTHKPIIYELMLSESQNGGDARSGNARGFLGSANRGVTATVNALQILPGHALRLTTSPQHRLIINPGSVGQPRDHDTRAAYAILDLEAMTIRCERVIYPVELTQHQMRSAGLPQRLIDRLSIGW